MNTFFTIGRFFSINLRRFVAWWPRVRARGKRSFVVRSGIMGLGIPMALATLLITGMARFIGGKPFTSGALTIDLAIGALLALFGGTLWGTGVWAFNNRLYDSLVKSR